MSQRVAPQARRASDMRVGPGCHGAPWSHREQHMRGARRSSGLLSAAEHETLGDETPPLRRLRRLNVPKCRGAGYTE